MRRFRKQRQAKAHHAVGAHLQQHARQHHRTRRGRFRMRVGQPGVQREQRHLDGERQKKCHEQQHLRARLQHQRARLNHLLDRRQIKCAGGVVQPDNCHQHQNRAGHGVQNEFHRGVNAPLVSPDADQEVHGDQHHFPEQEEQKQIQRQETRRSRRLPASAASRRSPLRGD